MAFRAVLPCWTAPTNCSADDNWLTDDRRWWAAFEEERESRRIYIYIYEMKWNENLFIRFFYQIWKYQHKHEINVSVDSLIHNSDGYLGVWLGSDCLHEYHTKGVAGEVSYDSNSNPIRTPISVCLRLSIVAQHVVHSGWLDFVCGHIKILNV